MNYLGNISYLALKPEAVENTPVIPTNFFPLVSENIKTNMNIVADRRMKGIDWKSDDVLKGIRKHEGDIVILGDPTGITHLLNMTMLKGSTTGSATGYTHPFTVGNPKSYTIEIQKGPYAQRYFGVKADALKSEFVDQKLQLTATIKATGQFSIARLKEALSGSVTSLKLAGGYDIKPNTGLVVGDTLVLVKDDGSTQDIVLTSVNADGETVGFSTLTLTVSAGNEMYLKPQTPSYTTLSNPLFQGNTLVGVAVDSSTADSNAGAVATATPMYEFNFTLKNNIFDGPATGSQDPIKLVPQIKEAQLSISRLFETTVQRNNWLNTTKNALTMISRGEVITGGTTRESLTVKFHNIKQITHDHPMEVDSLIFDTQEFEALYDNTDGKALEITVINKTAGTAF